MKLTIAPLPTVAANLKRGLAYAAAFSLCVNILTLVPSLYMLQIFDRVLASRSKETLAMLTIMAVGSLLLLGGLEIVRARILASVGLLLERKLGGELFHSVLEAASRLGGRIQSGVLRDVTQLRGFLGSPTALSLMDIPWIPVYLLIIFLLHPQLGLFALAAATLLLLLAYATERLTHKPSENLMRDTRSAGYFSDVSLRNAEVIGGLGMAASIGRRWERLNQASLDCQAIVTTRSSALSATAKIARLMVQVMLYVVGALLVIDQQITAGAMLAASILLGRALQPIEALVSTWKVLVEARGAYARLSAYMNEIGKAKGQTPISLPVPEGALRAERLTLMIPGQDKPLLQDISFDLQAGESLGLIGPSAAGKSSLARALIGLWHPTAGAVRLDGADIAQWPRGELAPYLGYLPQDVELFAGTVAENVSRFCDFDDESVIAAAKRANVHEMILRLPKGYDTRIGNGGVILSGGQAQRVGLARALYGYPRLVVLDEPNANLDNEGEEALLASLRSLKQKKVTVIVISHRPSVLSDVDKLLVLYGGRVQSFGSRAAIMQRLTTNPSAQQAPSGVSI